MQTVRHPVTYWTLQVRSDPSFPGLNELDAMRFAASESKAKGQIPWLRLTRVRLPSVRDMSRRCPTDAVDGFGPLGPHFGRESARRRGGTTSEEESGQPEGESPVRVKSGPLGQWSAISPRPSVTLGEADRSERPPASAGGRFAARRDREKASRFPPPIPPCTPPTSMSSNHR